MNTDITIIGAGPAGCITALLLAKKYRVTLLEIKKLPRRKSCSGVLIKKSVDILRKYFGEIPRSAQCYPRVTTGLNIITHEGESLEFPDEGHNILRDKLDYWLLNTARERGVEVLEEASLMEVSQEEDGHSALVKWKGDRIPLVSKAMIACDGVYGSSRRLFRAPEQPKVITHQRFFKGQSGLDPSKFYAYTSPLFSQYDAWINEKNGEVVIGSIGFDRKSAVKHLDRFVSHLIEKEGFHLSDPLRQETWALPFVLPNTDILYQHNGAFFAGEAAGLLNPFGEGISCALQSGIALGESLLDTQWISLQNVDSIQGLYRKKMQNQVKYMKRQWELLKDCSPEFFQNTLECYKQHRLSLNR